MVVFGGTNNCARKQRNQGVLIPQCPPRNDLELGGPNAEPEYYLFAFSERDPYKATYDMLVETGFSQN